MMHTSIWSCCHFYMLHFSKIGALWWFANIFENVASKFRIQFNRDFMVWIKQYQYELGGNDNILSHIVGKYRKSREFYLSREIGKFATKITTIRKVYIFHNFRWFWYGILNWSLDSNIYNPLPMDLKVTL